MANDPPGQGQRASGLETRLRRLGADTNAATEWAWVTGRLVIVATVTMGLVLLLQSSSAFPLVMGLLGFVVCYDLALAYMLRGNRAWQVFALGMALDSLVLLAGWWVVALAESGSTESQDFYLILFPVLALGVARLGLRLGTAYTAFWLGWLTFSTLRFEGAGSYDLEQLPLRLLFLAATAGLTLRLTARLIAQRRRAEEATQRSSALYEHMTDVALLADVEGRLLEGNREALRLLGRDEEEIRGLPMESLVAEEDRAAFQAAFQEAKKGGRAFAQLSLLSAGGERLPVELRGAFVDVAGGPLFQAIGRDLSERQRLEGQLIEAERLRALGGMASGIAHDFSNLLSPIVGYSEILLRHPEMAAMDSKLSDYLQTINTAAQDAADLTRRLRQFYRKRGVTESDSALDLNGLVREVVDLTQPRWQSEALSSGAVISMETDLEEIPLTAGSESEIRELLVNLVVNAVDAMPEGGAIILRTRREGQDVVLQVADSGIGMPEEVRARCFEPFFSTKGDSGTGLGLAMVYGIVQRHQGSIDVESEPGQGATFTIRLPAYQGEVAQGALSQTPVTGLRVLLVDDEPQVLQTLRATLLIDDHEVDAASSGGEALELSQRNGYDVVIKLAR